METKEKLKHALQSLQFEQIMFDYAKSYVPDEGLDLEQVYVIDNVDMTNVVDLSKINTHINTGKPEEEVDPNDYIVIVVSDHDLQKQDMLNDEPHDYDYANSYVFFSRNIVDGGKHGSYTNSRLLKESGLGLFIYVPAISNKITIDNVPDEVVSHIVVVEKSKLGDESYHQYMASKLDPSNEATEALFDLWNCVSMGDESDNESVASAASAASVASESVVVEPSAQSRTLVQNEPKPEVEDEEAGTEETETEETETEDTEEDSLDERKPNGGGESDRESEEYYEMKAETLFRGKMDAIDRLLVDDAVDHSQHCKLLATLDSKFDLSAESVDLAPCIDMMVKNVQNVERHIKEIGNKRSKIKSDIEAIDFRIMSLQEASLKLTEKLTTSNIGHMQKDKFNNMIDTISNNSYEIDVLKIKQVLLRSMDESINKNVHDETDELLSKKEELNRIIETMKNIDAVETDIDLRYSQNDILVDSCLTTDNHAIDNLMAPKNREDMVAFAGTYGFDLQDVRVVGEQGNARVMQIGGSKKPGKGAKGEKVEKAEKVKKKKSKKNKTKKNKENKESKD